MSKSGKSGLTEAQRLQAGGLAAQKSSMTKIRASDLSFAPKGHPLSHPRAEDDPGDDLVDSIVSNGFDATKPIVAFEVTVDEGKKALWVIAGSRRRNASCKAEEILRSAGKLRRDDAHLYVPVEIFDGTEAEALAYRLRENGVDPLKKPDTASVLCATYKQLAALDWTAEQMAEARGGTSVAEVEALLRFDTLPKATRSAFDDGRLPFVLIAPFLDEIPRDKHPEAVLAAVDAGGCEHPRMAKRAAIRAAKGQESRGGQTTYRPSKKHIEAIAASLDAEHAVVAAIVRMVAFGDTTSLAEGWPHLLEQFEAVKPKPGRKPSKTEEDEETSEQGSDEDVEAGARRAS